MQILPKEKWQETKLEYPVMRHKNTKAYETAAKLEIDEGMIIPQKEWHGKGHPTIGLNSMTYSTKRKNYQDTVLAKKFIGKKFSVRKLKNNKGWLVVRVR